MLRRNLFFMLIAILVFSTVALAGEVEQYVLGPEDVIDFSVWNHPELKQQVVVGPDGTVSLPLIGVVKVDGMTSLQAANHFTGLLKQYINDPKVTVSVVKFKTSSVSIIGAVTKPGVFQVGPSTRLLEVLALAGVNERNAKLEEVLLTRKEVVIKIDVERLLFEGGHQNYLLQSGDVIFVPYIVRQVYILGEVNKPGAYEIGKFTTPADVLAMAGGPTKRADLERVKIIHRKGTNQEEIVDLNGFLKNNSSGLTYLQDGDIIQVGESRTIDWEKIFTYAAGIKVIHDLIVNW